MIATTYYYVFMAGMCTCACLVAATERDWGWVAYWGGLSALGLALGMAA